MFVRPANLAEALDRLSPGVRVLAGCTDLLPAAGEAGLVGDFIDVSRLAEIQGIHRTRDEISFGGATTWCEIVRADLPPPLTALKAAAREVGAVQIQNRGTIAGNLCNASPAADGVPPLLALDADVELASRRGRGACRWRASSPVRAAPSSPPTRSWPLSSAPRRRRTVRSTFLKLGARRYLVISIAMVAVALDIEDDAVRAARVAVGACSPVAMRLPAAERRLVGAAAREGLGARLQPEDFADLAPIDDVRADVGYRRAAALTLTQRAVELCLRGESGGAV